MWRKREKKSTQESKVHTYKAINGTTKWKGEEFAPVWTECILLKSNLLRQENMFHLLPSTEERFKLDKMTVHCNPSTWEVEAGGSRVKNHLHLPKSFMPTCATWDPILKLKKAYMVELSWVSEEVKIASWKKITLNLHPVATQLVSLSSGSVSPR